MKKNEWHINYDNDTGPDDEAFREWWEVTNGEMTFTTRSQEDAEWLLATLAGKP